jgi:hypothetical protein
MAAIPMVALPAGDKSSSDVTISTPKNFLL